MVFSKGEGSHIVDPEGNKYIDFLSAYSAVNQVGFFPGNYCFFKFINVDTVNQQSTIMWLGTICYLNRWEVREFKLLYYVA